jgi:hypothetical protein
VHQRPHADANGHGNADRNWHGYADRNRHCNADCNGDRDPDFDGRRWVLLSSLELHDGLQRRRDGQLQWRELYGCLLEPGF